MKTPAAVIVVWTLSTGPLRAETYIDELNPLFSEAPSITGHLRLYDFREWNSNNQPYPSQDTRNSFDNRGTAIGGDLLLKTGTIYGVSAGLSLYTQQAALDYGNENPSLAPHVSQIGEAYVRYESPISQITAGRQLMDTPFANGDMYTMLTRSFQGFSGVLDLGKPAVISQQKVTGKFDFSISAPFVFDTAPGDGDLKLYVARMTKYQSRSSGDFTDENRYSAGLNNVDPTIPLNAPGLFASGAQYAQGLSIGDVLVRGWAYNFFDYANLQFLETGYQAPKVYGDAKPYGRIQFLHESDSGAALAGKVRATYYGATFGVRTATTDLAVILENAPRHFGTFRNGGLVHPYSDLSGVLYDDTLNSGLEDLGPGKSLGAQANYSPSMKYTFGTKYVHYLAYYGTNGSFYAYNGPAYFSGKGLTSGQIVPDQSNYEWDISATLHGSALSSKLKGLSLSDSFGLRGGFGSLRTFAVNRLRIVYAF